MVSLRKSIDLKNTLVSSKTPKRVDLGAKKVMEAKETKVQAD